MALTEFQRSICRLVAANRIASGESYVAGAVALNELIGAARVSRDIDLFHDTEHAVEAAWRADRQLLENAGFEIRVVRERPGFAEAEVGRGRQTVLMQWARDSAFRFFPLVQHEEFGLVLHPFDLATNKVLALVGRLEARDWIDVIACDQRLQPLGYLAWAACGKDPGFSPPGIIEQAARSARYSHAEIAELSFAGPVPDAAALSRTWHAMVEAARQIIAALPGDEAGKCVLGSDGELFHGSATDLPRALHFAQVKFHAGRIRGALPQLVSGGG
jgi:hypothetical protein